jgi:hypothetical protein
MMLKLRTKARALLPRGPTCVVLVVVVVLIENSNPVLSQLVSGYWQKQEMAMEPHEPFV